MSLRTVLVVFSALLLASSVATAGTIVPFSVYENADGADTSPVGKISLEVEDNGDGTGFFKFTNGNASTSSVKVGAVYFETGLGTYIENVAFDSASSSTGVLFNSGASPGSAKGKLSPVWLGEVFDADAKNKDALHGSEVAYFSFDFKSTSGLSDVLGVLPHDGLNQGRIVMHVQGLENDYSVWAVTVPLPSGAWAGLALLGGIGMIQIVRRRRRATAI